MTRCDNCKEMDVITTTCKTCFPKEDRAMYQGLMAGDNVEFKPVHYPLDDKGLITEAEFRRELRDHRKEEGAIGNI